jgi:hypothetical protein
MIDRADCHNRLKVAGHFIIPSDTTPRELPLLTPKSSLTSSRILPLAPRARDADYDQAAKAGISIITHSRHLITLSNTSTASRMTFTFAADDHITRVETAIWRLFVH